MVLRDGGERAGDVLGSEQSAPPLTQPTAGATAEPTASPTVDPTSVPTSKATTAPALEPAPAETVTARPVPRQRSSAPEQAPDDGTGYGATPGVVTHRYSATKRTYTATTQGITLTATFSTTRARTGESVTIDLTASRGEPSCCGLFALYGDGADDTSQDSACPQPRTTQRSATFEHTWNKAKRWVLQLQASQSGCDAGGGSTHVVMRVSIDITPGTTTSNGPSQPTVKVDQSTPPRPGDTSYASYFGTARDSDGYLTKLVLDYGDGTAPKTFRGDLRECRNGPGGQPGVSDADLPYDPPHQHHYTQPGEYVVTLTAYSAGCDGRAVQTGSASFTYVAS